MPDLKSLKIVHVTRTPVGGTLRLRLPLYFGGLDPHSLDDPLSALFASAIADPLFGLDSSGKPYPALASKLPERTEQGVRLSLRCSRATRCRPLRFSASRSTLSRNPASPYVESASSPRMAIS